MTCWLDKDGNVWYTDFGEMFIGKFDPKTLKLIEYPIKKFKDKAPTGLLSIDWDHTGKLWFDTMYQGSLGNLDPKTGEITYYPLPPEYNDERVQLNFTGLRHDVDGKVWTKSVGTQDIFRLDLATNTWEKLPSDRRAERQAPPASIRSSSDSKNNLWMAEFTGGHLGKIDAKTLKVTWYPVPTPLARARRMNIDDQDRILVTEYRGNQVALFDPKTEKLTEYMLPPYTFPYRASFDKNGEIWASTMRTDRAVRVDPKTGQWVQYLDAGRHQHAHGVHRQYDHAGDVLGRQQPRPPARQGRAAGLVAATRGTVRLRPAAQSISYSDIAPQERHQRRLLADRAD